MEYSATAWSPHTTHDIILNLRKFSTELLDIFNDYSSFHSVSAMLNQLNWPSLKTHRDYLKFIMFYKIIEGLVDITHTPDLAPVLSVTRGHSYRLYITSSQINCHPFSFFPTVTNFGTLYHHIRIVETNTV